VIFDPKRPVLLWGTGSLARTVFERLSGVVAFSGAINNKGGEGSRWNGLPVLTAAEALDGHGAKPLVVVATMFLGEILPELERRDLRVYRDWCSPEHALERLRPQARSVRPAAPRAALRVLHINWQIWGSGFSGGHVAHAEALIKSLSAIPNLEQGYLYTAGRWQAGDNPLLTSRRDGLRVYEIVNNPIRSHVETPDCDLENELVETLVSQAIEDYRPDVVHIHHLIQFPLRVLDVVRRRHGVPVVVTLRDFWYVCKQATLRSHLGTLCVSDNDCRMCADCVRHTSPSPDELTSGMSQERFVWRKYRYLHALEQCEALTFVSAYLRDEYTKLGLSGANAHVCRNGISIADRSFRRAASPLKHVAFLGQVRDYKGAFFVLESLRAWAGAPFHLHFLGWLDDPARFAAAVRALPDTVTVTFDGAYERRDLPALLADIDLGLVPSLVADTAPQVVMEFFACKVPVLASNIGGIPESVRHGTDGLLFEPGDTQSFLCNLDAALKNEVWATLRDGISHPRSIADYAAEIHGIYQRLATAGVPDDSALAVR
jgi:glycosyltransferase involved in cell wall biosynthesis